MCEDIGLFHPGSVKPFQPQLSVDIGKVDKIRVVVGLIFKGKNVKGSGLEAGVVSVRDGLPVEGSEGVDVEGVV